MDHVNFDEDVLKRRLIDQINKPSTQDTQNMHDNLGIPVNRLSANILMESYNVVDVEFFSHRKYFGKFIVLAKRLLRKLLKPILNKQTHFNRKIVEALLSLEKAVYENNSIQTSLEHVNQKIDAYSKHNHSFAYELTDLKSRIEKLEASLNKLRSEIDSLQDHIHSEQTISEYSNQKTVNMENEKNLEDRIKSSIFATLSEFYKEQNDYKNSYFFLLLALKFAPDDRNIEDRTLKAFRLLNQK